MATWKIVVSSDNGDNGRGGDSGSDVAMLAQWTGGGNDTRKWLLFGYFSLTSKIVFR